MCVWTTNFYADEEKGQWVSRSQREQSESEKTERERESCESWLTVTVAIKRKIIIKRIFFIQL